MSFSTFIVGILYSLIRILSLNFFNIPYYLFIYCLPICLTWEVFVGHNGLHDKSIFVIFSIKKRKVIVFTVSMQNELFI